MLKNLISGALIFSFALTAFAHDKHENGQDMTVKTQKIGGKVAAETSARRSARTAF